MYTVWDSPQKKGFGSPCRRLSWVSFLEDSGSGGSRVFVFRFLVVYTTRSYYVPSNQSGCTDRSVSWALYYYYYYYYLYYLYCMYSVRDVFDVTMLLSPPSAVDRVLDGERQLSLFSVLSSFFLSCMTTREFRFIYRKTDRCVD